MGATLISVLAMVIFTIALIVAWVTKNENLGILLGAASSNATIAVGYWLGSSSGSRAKDALIAAKPPTGGTL
jgi:hypothetical protein